MQEPKQRKRKRTSFKDNGEAELVFSNGRLIGKLFRKRINKGSSLSRGYKQTARRWAR